MASAPRRVQEIVRRLARVPVLYKILGANVAIVVLGVVIGTFITLEHGAQYADNPHYELIGGFILAGIGISLAVNFLILRAVLRPLDHLQRAVDAVRAGRPGVRVERTGLWDERFDHLADTFDRMVAALEEHAERLRRLPGQILRAQEEERRRIARELHDEAAQSLTSLLVRLRLLEQARTPETAQERVTELRELTIRALYNVHKIAVELRPSALDDLGLVAALHAHIDDLNAAGGIGVKFDADGAEGRFPPEVELALYRVAQEALTNVQRHAGASQAWVRLRRQGSSISLEVQDDGAGFDPMQRRSGNSGLGLAGMEERIGLIGGTLTVRSEPGRGTTIIAHADLPRGSGAR